MVVNCKISKMSKQSFVHNRSYIVINNFFFLGITPLKMV